MTRRFADLGRHPSTVEEPIFEPPVEVPAEPVKGKSAGKKTQLSRGARAETEALMVVQARVPQSVRRNFSKVLIDIQDDFPKGVSQEESITALLHMVAENPRARSMWVKAIQERREQP